LFGKVSLCENVWMNRLDGLAHFDVKSDYYDGVNPVRQAVPR
jgi:hypothetical protein